MVFLKNKLIIINRQIGEAGSNRYIELHIYNNYNNYNQTEKQHIFIDLERPITVR